MNQNTIKPLENKNAPQKKKTEKKTEYSSIVLYSISVWKETFFWITNIENLTLLLWPLHIWEKKNNEKCISWITVKFDK